MEFTKEHEVWNIIISFLQKWCDFFSFTVKALLDKGADPNQKDILGNTPLHLGMGSPFLLIKQLAIDISGDLTVRVLLRQQIYKAMK